LKTCSGAYHILHYHSIGHISVRSPVNPATFYLPYNISHTLSSDADDFVEYNVADASPVEKDVKASYLEDISTVKYTNGFRL
jgi:hypothetical protein